MTIDISHDILVYLAEVSKWLQSCPDGKTPYGEFYPSELPVTLDGDVVGRFRNEDPEWVFEFDAKYWGVTR